MAMGEEDWSFHCRPTFRGMSFWGTRQFLRSMQILQRGASLRNSARCLKTPHLNGHHLSLDLSELQPGGLSGAVLSLKHQTWVTRNRF